MRDPVLISVLVPVFNEEANIERAYDAIREVFARLPDCAYEIIFTDNHSTDASPQIMRAIAERDGQVRVVRFSRNYGYQRSLLVAHKLARGDCSVQIDCDLQDPPALIPQMLELWRSGYQVVYGIRRSRQEGRGIGLVRRAYYRLIAALSDDDLALDAGEFRLVDRVILDELRRVEDTSPYLRGLIAAMGFRQIGFQYDRAARVAGASKFPLKAMLGLGVDGILNHSLVPLRLASLLSLAIGVGTLLLAVGYLVGRFAFGQEWPAGFATTTLLLLTAITLNAMFLGILGEYVGRIFLQIKRRPMPIIEATMNCDGISGAVSPPRPQRDLAPWAVGAEPIDA